MFIDFRKEGGKRKKNISVSEIHWLVASYMCPDQE